jgi:hypothetical protein
VRLRGSTQPHTADCSVGLRLVVPEQEVGMLLCGQTYEMRGAVVKANMRGNRRNPF